MLNEEIAVLKIAAVAMVLGVLLAVQGCATQQKGEPGVTGDAAAAAVDGGAAKTLVYECGDTDVVARVTGETMVLHLPDDYRALARVRSASGARYEESDLTFWIKGREAMLQQGEKRYPNCILNPERAPWEEARRRGVSFRAVGQEPGWVLEIQPGKHMLLDADYGALRVLLPAPEAELTEAGERYEIITEKHKMRVDIRLESCADTMSGAVYRNQVTATLDGRVFNGCGDALEPL